MKTNMAATSLSAYRGIAAELQPMEAKIIRKMLVGKVYSRRELAVMARMETSCVAGRVNRMLDTGALASAGTLKCPITGKTVEAVRIPSPQLELC